MTGHVLQNGGAALAGKMKRGLQVFFGATTGGVDYFEVAGSTVIPADLITGKAEEEQRRLAKGKGKVTEDGEEEEQAAAAVLAGQQRRARVKAKLMKFAAMALGSEASLEEVMGAAVPTPVPAATPQPVDQHASCSRQGSIVLLHSRRPSACSSSSAVTDVELSLFAEPAGPSRSASGCSEWGRASGSSSYMPSGDDGHVVGSSSMAGAWDAAGTSSSSINRIRYV
ncbi:hypothetical protein ACK3TF_001061 [Chlorella vulgaris]